MTTIEFQRGITTFQRFPITCTVEQLREDLAALDWDAVDADGVDDPREAVVVRGSAVEGQTMALLVVSGWVDHEETGQGVAEEPRMCWMWLLAVWCRGTWLWRTTRCSEGAVPAVGRWMRAGRG